MPCHFICQPIMLTCINFFDDIRMTTKKSTRGMMMTRIPSHSHILLVLAALLSITNFLSPFFFPQKASSSLLLHTTIITITIFIVIPSHNFISIPFSSTKKKNIESVTIVSNMSSLKKSPTEESTTSSSSSSSSTSSTTSDSSSASSPSPSSSTSPSTSPSTSFLASIPQGGTDGILEIAEAYQKCSDGRKVNICIGAYRDECGRPWVLPSVRNAEELLMTDPHRNKEYAGVTGDQEYVSHAIKFAYGDIHIASTSASTDMDIAAIQTLSGTGACRVGAEFLSKFAPVKCILVPDPTWGNHIAIFEAAGLKVVRYRYYNRLTNGLDFDGMMEDLRCKSQHVPDGAIVLLHACAHNPTGCDPSRDQWMQLSDVCKQRKFQVFFDNAYQGFASGDAEEDAFAIRYFAEEYTKHAKDECYGSMMVAQSFSKNFGLYGERCGTLSIVVTGEQDVDSDANANANTNTNAETRKERVLSQLKSIIRPMYSSPPIHGSSIVKAILSNDKLSKQYYDECRVMARRIISMRMSLIRHLAEAGSAHDWSHIGKQRGMFAFTGMSSAMCQQLTDEYCIFLTLDGRISLAGLNETNVDYVARAMHAVTRGKSITSAGALVLDENDST